MATTDHPRALTGALPALVTPLSDPDTIDAGTMVALVESALADRASGVLVAGTTGEGSLLLPEQRVELTRLARRAVDGSTRPDAMVVAGASGPNLRAIHADVARLAEAGADQVLVLPPSLQPLSPDEVADLHLEVAESATVPTLAYHIPQLTGCPLTPDAVRRFASHERIVGMKDSSPDPERRAAFVAATREVPGFTVMTGHAPTLVEHLRSGGDGCILAIANIRLRQAVEAVEAVAAGDDTRADDLQDALTRATAGVGGVGSSVPAVLKAAMQLEGAVAERWCVPPLRSVEGARLDHVRTALLR